MVVVAQPSLLEQPNLIRNSHLKKFYRLPRCGPRNMALCLPQLTALVSIESD
jgi:hypothetical protein